MIKNKEICIICKKECDERGIGGDRYQKEYLKAFNIISESIYEDSWKGFYFVCWDCIGEFKKKKQKEFLYKFENMEEEYFENGSPTWYQSGIMDFMRFLIKRTKDILKSPNTLDGAFEAWLNGIFEVTKRLDQSYLSLIEKNRFLVTDVSNLRGRIVENDSEVEQAKDWKIKYDKLLKKHKKEMTIK